MSYKDTRISMLRDVTDAEGLLDNIWMKMKEMAESYNDSVRIGNLDYLDHLHSDLFTKNDALLVMVRDWNKRQGYIRIHKADGTIDRIENDKDYTRIPLDENYFTTVPKTIPELLAYFFKYQELALSFCKDNILERYELRDGFLVNTKEDAPIPHVASAPRIENKPPKTEKSDLKAEFKSQIETDTISAEINAGVDIKVKDAYADKVAEQREARERMVNREYVNYRAIHDRVIAGVDSFRKDYEEARQKYPYFSDYVTKMLIIQSLAEYPSQKLRDLMDSFTFGTEDFVDCLFCKIHQYRKSMIEDDFLKELRDLATNTKFLFKSELKTRKDSDELKNPYSPSKLATPLKEEKILDFLRFMVETMASHFGNIAHVFAIDATGFSLDEKGVYCDTKHGKRRRSWKDVHAICDVDSNIVTSVIATDQYEKDELEAMETLIEHTQKHFRIAYLIGDGGYLNQEKMEEIIENRGVRYYSPMRKNAVYSPNPENPHYEDNMDFWMSDISDIVYHQRSNIETVFSSVKHKFEETLSSTCDIGRLSECYIKFINYNIWVTVVHYFSSKGQLYPEFLDGEVLKELRATKPYTPSPDDLKLIKSALAKVESKRSKRKYKKSKQGAEQDSENEGKDGEQPPQN